MEQLNPPKGALQPYFTNGWRNSAPRKALAFSGCNSRPETGSLHPMAIEVGCFSVTKSTVF